MSNRIALWDNLKFILITFVVAGHFADEIMDYSSIYSSIFLFIYAFHMPLFIFISGYFHSDRNKKKKVLFYNGSLRMGGIERVLVEVLQNIDKNQMDIDLVIEDGTKTLNVFEKDIPKDKFKVAFNEGMEVCANSGTILENVIINLKDGVMLAFNI